MEVLIKNGEEVYCYDVPFSIGDIVTIVSYGHRYCDQDKSYKMSSFYKGDKLNWGDFAKTDYCILDECFKKAEWKVLDIGTVSVVRKGVKPIFLGVKIINRVKEEMMIQYDAREPDKCFNVVRPNKKQYDKYVIEL